MKALDILEDVSALVQRTDFDSLESLVQELDRKYNDFWQAFKERGTILTKDRTEIISTIKKLCDDEKLCLFAILAPFGFGKTVTIQKIIDLINGGEIRYGQRTICPVHLRLNRQTDRGKIVLKLLRDLGVTTDESFLRLIYEGIKNDELVKAACEQHNEDWVVDYLRNCFFKDETLDLVLNKAANDELIRLMEKVVQSYEELHESKVVLIIDEVEHSIKGFSDPFVHFLAMIIRYCFEKEHNEFVGIIAMTTTMIDQPQMPLFQALKDMGAGDVFDRIREKHISRELSLTPETATELVSRILNFYLNSLVSISKAKPWKDILKENEDYGTKLYTYPISHDLLEYLSLKGLKSSKITGVIPDFRVYLTLIGVTLDIWIQELATKKVDFEGMIAKKEALDIRQFWELNEKIRVRVQDYISQGQILPAIFRQDVIQWIDKQLCSEIKKDLFRKILSRIIMEAIKSGKSIFNEEEISKQFDLDEDAIEDFRGCIPGQFKEIVSFEYGSLHVDLDKLQAAIVSTEETAAPDQELKKIREYLDTKIDGVPLLEANLILLLKKWKVETTKEWAIDKDDKQILVERTSNPWNNVLYITENPDKDGEIRDRLKKSNRFDIGLIIDLQSELKCKFIYPNGLQAQEKAAEEEIIETASNLLVTEEYKALEEKVEKLKSGLGEAKKAYIITLLLPTFFRFTGKTDYPLAFNNVNLWSEIENLFRNPPPAYENRWIETRIGIIPETQFKEVVSTFLKLIVIKGSEAKFKAYDEAVVWRHERVKLFEDAMKTLGFEKEWRDPPMSASAFQDRTRKNYPEILPIDESTDGLKSKVLLNNTLQKALEWIKEETEKKGSISLSTVSEKFFGVPVESKDSKSVSWNISIKGKRALLLLLALSSYYGDTYLDRKNGLISIMDPSQMAELQADKIRADLLAFARAAVACKLLSNQELVISKPRKYWQRLTNIMQDENTKPKEKSQFLQALKSEWVKEGLQTPEVKTETEEGVHSRVQKIMKSAVIEKNYRGVGQYLKEADACLALPNPENEMVLSALAKLVSNVELETRAIEANARVTNIIENLGKLTKEKPSILQPKVLDSLENLNTKLKKAIGENWSEKSRTEPPEVVIQNCRNIYESGKIEIELTKSKIQKSIPSLTSDFTDEQIGVMDAKASSLIESFSTELEKLNKTLGELKNKLSELLKKRFLSDELKTEITGLEAKISGQIDDLDGLNVEANFVESTLEGGRELVKKAESIYAKAMVSFGDKEEIAMLELCDKYDYNIVALLKGEFSTEIQTLMSTSKHTANEDKAKVFLLKMLELASKNKLSLSLRW